LLHGGILIWATLNCSDNKFSKPYENHYLDFGVVTRQPSLFVYRYLTTPQRTPRFKIVSTILNRDGHRLLYIWFSGGCISDNVRCANKFGAGGDKAVIGLKVVILRDFCNGKVCNRKHPFRLSVHNLFRRYNLFAYCIVLCLWRGDQRRRKLHILFEFARFTSTR